MPTVSPGVIGTIRTALVLLGATSLVRAASAETHVEAKLLQFGGPETRLARIGDIKTKGIPSCSMHHFHLQCHDNWITIKCGQKKAEFKQHSFLPSKDRTHLTYLSWSYIMLFNMDLKLL
jgi:hypothetical protein